MPKIEEYAAKALMDGAVGSLGAEGGGPAGEGEAETAARRSELYMALCTRKHTMLKGLMESFAGGGQALRQAIHKQVKQMPDSFRRLCPPSLCLSPSPSLPLPPSTLMPP